MSKLTYDDFVRSGRQDCANALSIDEFDVPGGVEQGWTAEQIVDHELATWDEEEGKAAWLDQQDDFEGLDPDKAYEAWKSGWRDCAIRHIEVAVESYKQRQLDEAQAFYVMDLGAEEIVDNFDSLEEALGALAKMPTGTIVMGDLNGPNETIVEMYQHGRVHAIEARVPMPFERFVEIAKAKGLDVSAESYRDKDTITRTIKWYEHTRPPLEDDDDYPEEVVTDEGEEEIESDAGWGILGVAQAAAEFLKKQGVRGRDSASSTHFHPGIWYETEPYDDPYTGASDHKSFHLEGFTDREEAEVWQEITGQKVSGQYARVRRERPKANPARSFEEVKRQFETLVAANDLASLDVAQDLLEENEITLAQVSQAPSSRSMPRGAFDLSGTRSGLWLEWTVYQPHRGRFEFKVEARRNFEKIASLWVDGNSVGERQFARGTAYPSDTAAANEAARAAWAALRALVQHQAWTDFEVRNFVHQGITQYLEGQASGAMKRNPSVSAKDLEAAKDKFEEFHRKVPTRIGEFASSFKIPAQVKKLGKAVHVLYRSSKKNPDTGRAVKKPVDYIHDHDAGVLCCVPGTGTSVPSWIQETDALVKLGSCLGFCYKDDAGEHNAEGRAPLPELYATPCGKALLVIQDKKTLLAMMWGGGLGVEARGIVG